MHQAARIRGLDVCAEISKAIYIMLALTLMVMSSLRVLYRLTCGRAKPPLVAVLQIAEADELQVRGCHPTPSRPRSGSSIFSNTYPPSRAFKTSTNLTSTLGGLPRERGARGSDARGRGGRRPRARKPIGGR